MACRKILAIVCLFLLSTGIVHAQEGATLLQDTVTTVKAVVLAITNQQVKQVPGTDVKSSYQDLTVRILDGDEAGKEVGVASDFLNLKVGEEFYLIKTVHADNGSELYSVSEPYRLPAVFFFIGLFALCVVVFGGMQGLRGLISLAGSMALIFFVLLPGILHGYSPILVSFGVAALIIILGSYVTHGFNKTTSVAVLGMIVTVLLTGALAYCAVNSSRLSGFATEESVYLNLDTRGAIDFQGLLLGGILIGLLGILYDGAIGQAVSVEELHHIGPHLSRGTIFKRALRIGREHIGALVNTLAIAYVGVSLPLLLLFYSGQSADFFMTLNREIFATEVIRIVIGSIGLVLAIPITTVLAVFILVKPVVGITKENIKEETKAVEEFVDH